MDVLISRSTRATALCCGCTSPWMGPGRTQVSSQSVDGIAGKVGFASRSHFSRAFQEQYGYSPMEFRKQYH